MKFGACNSEPDKGLYSKHSLWVADLSPGTTLVLTDALGIEYTYTTLFEFGPATGCGPVKRCIIQSLNATNLLHQPTCVLVFNSVLGIQVPLVNEETVSYALSVASRTSVVQLKTHFTGPCVRMQSILASGTDALTVRPVEHLEAKRYWHCIAGSAIEGGYNSFATVYKAICRIYSLVAVATNAVAGMQLATV